MSEILSPETLAYLLGHVSAGATVPVSMDPEGPEDSVRNIIAAHDAALRAENERLALSLVDAEDRLAAAEECLRPFVDPASYSTNEEECRLNPAMDWCAVHSFRWPCPVAPARAFLAGGKTK